MMLCLQVRSAVLSMLHRLPIDLQQEGRKAQLKKSQLGRYVAFYSKLQDETLANRKLARGLVEKWSRTIYEQYKETGEEEAKQVLVRTGNRPCFRNKPCLAISGSSQHSPAVLADATPRVPGHQ